MDGVSVLPDTGANGFAYIDSRCAYAVSKCLGEKPKNLGYSIQSKGFDGKKGPVISQYILLSLWINGRRLDNLPFLIVDLGSHDVILGSRFLAHFDIMIDSRQRRLVWPTDHPETLSFSSPIRTLLQYLLTDRPKLFKIHQKDVTRRDSLFNKEDRMAMYGARSTKRPVQYKKSLHPASRSAAPIQTSKLNEEYDTNESASDDSAGKNLKLTNIPSKSDLDLCHLSAPALHSSLGCTDHTPSFLSLKEIQHEIEEKEDNSVMYESQDLELEKIIPSHYHDLLDVFSKSDSNLLPPHRPYDHKIELENLQHLSAGPLYPMSSEKLKAVHKYILENIDKGFIEPSKAPFSSPVLFVKKADGSLRFSIDFRKLNAITKKDRYPLPLIDETLARLNKAKIFTKLDIRQAFLL